MQARFLLGPAGSGKTHCCLEEIRQALLADATGAPLLLLAPKQATFQLERQLLAEPRLSGYTRLQILSFERLAEYLLEQLLEAPPRLLDEEGRGMVLRALLAQKGEELKLFHAAARLNGFAQQLGVLLQELQRHQLAPDRLAKLAAKTGLPPPLQDKLHDLALLLQAYLDWLKAHQLEDAHRLLDLAVAAVKAVACGARGTARPATALHLAGLWLDGFADLTPQELDLVAALLPHCERATLAFCLEQEPVEEPSWLSTWSVVAQTFRRCYARFHSLPGCEVRVEVLPRRPGQSRFGANPILQHLEQSWAHPQPFAGIEDANAALLLATCATPEAEAVLAAREIRRFVRQGGRFREAAVLLRSFEGYGDLLRRVFARYEIPFFLDRREPVAHHPLAELTRYAVRVAAFHWRHDDWFGALKTGLMPVAEGTIDELENEALARGWKGQDGVAPGLPGPDENGGDTWEKRRPPLTRPFVRLGEGLGIKPGGEAKAVNGVQLAEALRQFWLELEVGKRLCEWSEDRGLAEPASALHRTVWEQMLVWLDNVALAFPDKAMPLRDWLPILEAGLGGLTVGVIPPALDQVLIGAIDRSRNPDLHLALVLGLNESVFPAAPMLAPLLTETDRAALEQENILLGLNLRQRLAQERYYGYIACTRARQRLVLTCAATDLNGKILNPSPFLGHVRRLFPQVPTLTFSGQISTPESEHPCELAPLLAGAAPPPSLAALPALAERNAQLAPLRRFDPGGQLAPAVAAALYGPELKTSVSRLEQYAVCPFRFFVASGLGAEERIVFEVDARHLGQFQHEVLERFHQAVRAQGRQWRDLTPEEARQMISQIAQTLALEYHEGLFARTPENRFALRALTDGLEHFIEAILHWMRESYGFEPAAVELGFGQEQDPLPAWRLPLPGGQALAFRGRIDRIDLCAEPAGPGHLCVVMDYKSSTRQLDPVLLAHGIQMQLPAYLSVLRQSARACQVLQVGSLRPAGVFYINLKGKPQSVSSRAEALADLAAARRRAYQHRGRFDASLLSCLDRKPDQQPSGQFKYRLTKQGDFYENDTDPLKREEFEGLLDLVEVNLRRMGAEIFAGSARVNPYRKKNQTGCDHCLYQEICRIDPWTHAWRFLQASEAP